MKLFNSPISTENASLGAYTGRRYNKGFNSISFTDLESVSKNTSKSLSVLYRVFAGIEPEADATAISIAVESGAFKRFYGPTLSQKDDQLAIDFNGTALTFETKKGALIAGLPEGVDVKLGFESIDLNGFKETTFKVSIFIESSDTLLVFNLPIRFADYKAEKATTTDVLSTMLERKPKDLVAKLDTPYAGSDFDGPTLKLGQLITGEVYAITSVRAVNTTHGSSYMFTIEPTTPGQTYLEVASIEDTEEEVALEQAEVWSNQPLKSFFGSQPNITQENPAQLLIRGKKATKSGNITVDAACMFDSPDVVAVDEEDLDFNF